VMTMPPLPQLPEAIRGRRMLTLRAVYLGGAEEAERVLEPLLDAAGPPVMNGLREASFAEATTLGPPPPPAFAETHFELMHQVPDEVIAAAVEADGAVTAVELRHWGGAMARPEDGAGPIGHRDVPFSAVAIAQVEDREQLAAAQADLAQVAVRLRPHGTGGSFLNFLGDAGATASAYTPDDYRRLAEVKRDYDPDNLFRANHNIPPAA